MKLFQVGNIYPQHLHQLEPELRMLSSEEESNRAILADIALAQILLPAMSSDHAGRICFPQYETGLRNWAKKKGMTKSTKIEEIILAQIEDHKAEVFYSVNATRHAEFLLRNMPGCVKLKIGWLGSAASGPGIKFFDAIVSNFPTLNTKHSLLGLRTRYLTPSYEAQADTTYGTLWKQRPTGLFFSGSLSRHHSSRAQLMDRVCGLVTDHNIANQIRILKSRYTDLAELTPLGFVPPFSHLRRSGQVRRVALPALFGKKMFESLSKSRLALNIATEIAGDDRGNMRCFESLSAGALMIADAGNYPDGFIDGETHVSYSTFDEALFKIKYYLQHSEAAEEIAKNGSAMIRSRYSKERQWQDFVTLCSEL